MRGFLGVMRPYRHALQLLAASLLVRGGACISGVGASVAQQLQTHGASRVLPVGLVGLESAPARDLVNLLTGSDKLEQVGSAMVLRSSDQALLAVVNSAESDPRALSVGLAMAAGAKAGGLAWRVRYGDLLRGDAGEWMLKAAFARLLQLKPEAAGRPLVLVITGCSDADAGKAKALAEERVRAAFAPAAASRPEGASFDDFFAFDAICCKASVPDAACLKAVAEALRSSSAADMPTAEGVARAALAASDAVSDIAAAGAPGERLAQLLSARRARAKGEAKFNDRLNAFQASLSAKDADEDFGEKCLLLLAECEAVAKVAAGADADSEEVAVALEAFRRDATSRLELLFRLQVQLLRRSTLQKFQDESPQRVSPGLKAELEKSVSEARRFFVDGAQGLVFPGSEWTYEAELKDLQQVLSDSAQYKLQMARLQSGKPSSNRPPISLSLHLFYPEATLGFGQIEKEDTFYGNFDQPGVDSMMASPVLPQQDKEAAGFLGRRRNPFKRARAPAAVSGDDYDLYDDDEYEYEYEDED